MRVIKHLLIIVICVLGYMQPNVSFAVGGDEGGESGGGTVVTCPQGAVVVNDECSCKESMHMNEEKTACVISCERGEYLPSRGTECVSCMGDPGVAQNQYCPGDTFEYDDQEDQGIKNCVGDTVANSNKTGCEISCEVGKYFPKNSNTCSPCPENSVSEGKYCPGGGPYPYPNDTDQGLKSCPESSEDNKAYYIENNECIICPAGSQCSQWQKTECPAGKFSEQGSPECSVCAAGTYSDGEGSSSCTQCDAGEISNNDRTSCETCSDGTYAAEDNECKECHAGYYCKNGIESKCSDGEISRSTGGNTCVACSDAGFVANDAHTECVPQFINGGTTWKFPDFMKIIR